MEGMALLVAAQALGNDLQSLAPDVQVGHMGKCLCLYVSKPDWVGDPKIWDYFQHGFMGYRVRVKQSEVTV